MNAEKLAFQAKDEHAASAFFGLGIVSVSCKTFLEALGRVEAGLVDAAVIPIENSIKGGGEPEFRPAVCP